MQKSMHPELINEDFNTSVSMTEFTFETVYPLELTPERFTGLMKLSKTEVFHTRSIYNNLQQQAGSDELAIEPAYRQWRGFEVFVLEGTCSNAGKTYTQGSYFRIPEPEDNNLTAVNDCILFVKLNQFLDGDTGTRHIETRTPDEWLPGPVEGIEIRPLHVFDTESIMLLRWHHAAEFRPNLNPRGEEILVINGLLQNRDHLYRQYSWIRNPIEDWRKWHGNTGTLAYYKSGHFPDDPARQQDS